MEKTKYALYGIFKKKNNICMYVCSAIISIALLSKMKFPLRGGKCVIKIKINIFHILDIINSR